MRRDQFISQAILVLLILFVMTRIATAQEETPEATPAVEMAEIDCPPAAESTAEPEMTPEVETREPFTLTGDGEITVHQYPAEFVDISPGSSVVTFINMLPDDTNVSFYRNDVAYAIDLISSSTNQVTIPMDSGTYRFGVVDNSNPSIPFAEVSDVQIVDSYYYVIAAVEGSNGPDLRIQEVTRADYELAAGQLGEPGTLIEALNANGLCYLAEAIDDAGLTETLSGDGPYTLFVPAEFLSDEFAALGGDLGDVLLNHVVDGDLKSFDLMNMADSVLSLAGNPLEVQISGNTLTVNDRQVLRVNIPATNGTIHVIDGILAPGSGG